MIFQALCANLAVNCITNTDAFHCGCGSTTRTVKVPPYNYAVRGNFGGISLSDGAQGSDVEVRRLDDLFSYQRLKLLKIDVEGMEINVINGARHIIEAFRPVIYVENDRREKTKDLIDLISSLDYRMWWHLPRLFNPNNYFGNANDGYKGIVSVNMVCVHRSISTSITDLREVTDSSFHPHAR